MACAAGVSAGALALARHGRGLTRGQATGTALLTVTGFIDDVQGLPPAIRLVSQGTAGLISAPCGQRLRGAAVLPIAVNIVNFMDGINGISGLTAVSWGVTAAGARHAHPIAALVAGVGAGFLPWNVPRPRLFLGDSGSYLIGSLIGNAALHTTTTKETTALVVPLLPYLADALVTIGRRLARGEAVLRPHRQHAYQRLVHDHAWSHGQVAVTHGVLVAGLGLLANRSSTHVSVIVGATAATAWAFAPEALTRLQRDSRDS